MPLMRWEPLREIDSLQREMNRLFDSFTNETSVDQTRENFVPLAEINETSDAVHLKLEVPGVAAEDIDIQASTEAVAISGERKSEIKTENKGMTRTEFRYGKFRRIIPLPVRIQNTDIKADYKNGILTLTLPKAEEEKNKVVKVSLG
ncbi:Hsp20/alpha crystallin family protein [Lyngbya sp. PCC 8106]|uniref:Hsp20/alpha crystallin family protein n=1 Tax=Lyngbya sp. (strain PCC 8106) TaxID=313612 RepID=UPI0000EAD1B5|nr:Hsp20/alpha crystallin family protein [Lyngbya sp. PCC 8106]EAW38232.1 Heat shock protein [Lyngbya sp. PCC 8106]